MKKLFLKISLAVLFISGFSYGSVFDIYKSSFTKTADTLQAISTVPSVLYAICIDSTSVGGTFSIFNGTVATNVVSTTTIVDTSRTQIGCLNYNIYLSSGILYTNSGTTPAFINVMWNPFSH